MWTSSGISTWLHTVLNMEERRMLTPSPIMDSEVILLEGALLSADISVFVFFSVYSRLISTPWVWPIRGASKNALSELKWLLEAPPDTWTVACIWYTISILYYISTILWNVFFLVYAAELYHFSNSNSFVELFFFSAAFASTTAQYFA